jgi:hypothetical protein
MSDPPSCGGVGGQLLFVKKVAAIEGGNDIYGAPN